MCLGEPDRPKLFYPNIAGSTFFFLLSYTLFRFTLPLHTSFYIRLYSSSFSSSAPSEFEVGVLKKLVLTKKKVYLISVLIINTGETKLKLKAVS